MKKLLIADRNLQTAADNFGFTWDMAEFLDGRFLEVK